MSNENIGWDGTCKTMYDSISGAHFSSPEPKMFTKFNLQLLFEGYVKNIPWIKHYLKSMGWCKG